MVKIRASKMFQVDLPHFIFFGEAGKDVIRRKRNCYCFNDTPQLIRSVQRSLCTSSMNSILVAFAPLSIRSRHAFPWLLPSAVHSSHRGLPGYRKVFGSKVKMKEVQYFCMRSGTLTSVLVSRCWWKARWPSADPQRAPSSATCATPMPLLICEVDATLNLR